MTVCRERRMYSEVLGQGVTVRQLVYDGSLVEVITDDGTIYTPFEVNMLRQAREKIDPVVHLVKREFKGTIIKIGEKEE